MRTRQYGIDVSYHQGVIDWAKVKAAGVNYAVIRAGYGFNTIDSKFTDNITGAINAGIENIGVYWFSYAHDINDIRTECASCLAAIAQYKSKINMPVWFDWEEDSNRYVKNTYGVTLSAADIRNMATEWVNIVNKSGYKSGVYTNKTNANGWFKLSSGKYLWDSLGCEMWYARYGADTDKDLFIIPAIESTALAEFPNVNVLQYSDTGYIDGINSQRVDLNVFYVEQAGPEPPPPAPIKPEKIYADKLGYIEVRNASTDIIGIVDTAKSVIWHSVYYGVGDFEIYIKATKRNVDMLKVGNYVTRSNSQEVGIIERIEKVYDSASGKMIAVSGRFAKSILDRRHIFNLSGATNHATILRGNVETEIRRVVTENVINCTFNSKRNISIITLGTVAGITKKIVDSNGNTAQKQVSYDNLLSYTDEVLQEYKLGSLIVLDEERKKLQYTVYEGADRSVDNLQGNDAVIFSREFDNLSDSNYTYDGTPEKNVALIGGEGEGTARIYVLYGNSAGMERRETWIDGSSISQTYKDGETDKQYSTEQYASMLAQKGKQDLTELKAVETFTGTIDITNGNYLLNRDFSVGDIVTLQDNDLGIYANVRIISVTEVQDENGYTVTADYESEV